VAVVSFLIVALTEVAWSGTLTGFGRFEKIAGNPSMGYKQLYEWDLFVSPSDDSMVGPSRRLGAPAGEPARGDGYYRVDNLPTGTYSVYVSQPDFFASPKVVSDVQISAGQTTTVNVDLDVDYSTYFSESQQWTVWDNNPRWYQTFKAQGTSVRAVSWKMAGWGLYGGETATITVLEDNGTGDVRNWTPIGSATDGVLASDSDEWVRWNSGDVPMTPGKQYAVQVEVTGGQAIYKRDKDSQSYQDGRAYDANGVAQDFDLNMTVFTDRVDSVTHTRRSSGPGDFDGSLADTRWGQSFVASGDSLAAVDLFAAGGDPFDVTWIIREGGPDGPQVGPTKITSGAYFASSTDLLGVSYNPGEVPLVPGETYYIDVLDTGNFTPYTQPLWNLYDDGQAYRNGLPTGYDLSMTIIQNQAIVPEPSALVMLAAGAVTLLGLIRRRKESPAARGIRSSVPEAGRTGRPSRGACS
jgi:hypothetical protein